MNVDKAVEILRRMYADGEASREAKTMIHLFGVMYAEELADLALGEIAKRATGSESYKTEIRNGMKLAGYVDVKPGR